MKEFLENIFAFAAKSLKSIQISQYFTLAALLFHPTDYICCICPFLLFCKYTHTNPYQKALDFQKVKIISLYFMFLY